jgi:fatty acid desaturase
MVWYIQESQLQLQGQVTEPAFHKSQLHYTWKAKKKKLHARRRVKPHAKQDLSEEGQDLWFSLLLLAQVALDSPSYKDSLPQ